MLKLVASRLAQVIPQIVLISLFTFLLVNLIPGDVAHVLAGDNGQTETVERIRHELGLDEHPLRRYLDWMGGLVHGDLGRSLFVGEEVGSLLGQRLPVTISLTVMPLLVAIILGVPAGILAGLTRVRLVDRLVTASASVGVALPSFVLSLLLVSVFSISLGWLPATGYTHVTEDPVGWIRSIALPTIALSLAPAAVTARQLRGSIRDVLRSDYVLAAEAKGLRRRQVITRHVLRNAAPPAITALGVHVALLVSGAVAVELVFGLPGIGSLAVQAVSVRDITVVQGVVLTAAIGVVLVNLVVDIVQATITGRATPTS